MFAYHTYTAWTTVTYSDSDSQYISNIHLYLDTLSFELSLYIPDFTSLSTQLSITLPRYSNYMTLG